MTILITGAAGFIGFHVTKRLLQQGYDVIGIDNFDPYYSVELKKDRLNQLQHPHFMFEKVDIEQEQEVLDIFAKYKPQKVLHLAGQAGVRYSLENPKAYISANISGFFHILNACKSSQIEHFLYASSSSIYGESEKQPFSIQDRVDQPVSLYAATKKSNELMAYSYSHVYGLRTTGLRFFTVYGPWGRPDMAYYSFTEKIIGGKPISLYNHGDMRRDFTYIDDVVQAVVALLSKVYKEEDAPYSIFNIGSHSPEKLGDFVSLLEDLTGKEAHIEYKEMQPGDVKETYADITELQAEIDFAPSTSLLEGLTSFVKWYKMYHS
ncbi:SDR family NAD(P)-dependent oxidoreductase [Bacillus sp. 2205SS5-2]|uniref:SDR family NAD(P)-dependent oxidoreductase n=1 Tax=Bacillus sp. 2205SS5-2 TaxID=3109031 RepID=UPI0030068408